MPGFGFAVGEDRLVMSLPATAAIPDDAPEVFVVGLGEAGVSAALQAARRLRGSGYRTLVEPPARAAR